MEKTIKFQTIDEAAAFIHDHANTDADYTLNDCIMFGGGIYAYATECKEAGIPVNDNKPFRRLNESELMQLLAWMLDNDGHLTVKYFGVICT